MVNLIIKGPFGELLPENPNSRLSKSGGVGDAAAGCGRRV